MTLGVLCAACVLVIGVYAYMAQSPIWEPWRSWSPAAVNASYNQLVRGFRAGQLSMKIDVPSGLVELPDPYDPTANDLYREAPYKFHDLTYYKGRLYLYFGVAPAVLLFWPFAALTGHYLVHREAVLIFCTIGFLASVGLLWALWKRYFAEVSVGVLAACVLALGLVTGVPALLSWTGVYEVPISCGYMLTMLSLGAIWCALHEPERTGRWLAAASLAYGLAVASRPSFLFGAVILLVPVAHTWRAGKRIAIPLLAAVGPITLIGLGLMLYNARRFGNPFEFGLHYQLAGTELISRQFLSLGYLWFNFRVYFLEPARWGGLFPFIHNIVIPRVPPGHWEAGHPFGVLTSIPLVWLAVAAPLACRNRLAQTDSALRWFVSAMALLFGVGALIVSLYFCSAFRYEADFLPALVLLAVVGILGLERVLVDRPAWRRGVRLGWGLLLGFSVAFNLLVTLDHYSNTEYELGSELLNADRPTEAVAHFKRAIRLKPDSAEAHANLGTVLARLGRSEEAIRHFEEALYLKPDNAVAHHNLGYALYQRGRVPEAIREFEAALKIQPDYAEAHNSLGSALLRTGNVPSATTHYEEALRINPDYAEAHYNLGIALAQAGRLAEAMNHWEQVLRLRPDDVEAHYNLGLALEKTNRSAEAIAQFEQVLKLRPDFTEARDALARLKTGP